jgi:hypothetical protein
MIMQMKRTFVVKIVLVVGAILLTFCSAQAVIPALDNHRVLSSTVTFTQVPEVNDSVPKSLYPCLPKQVQKLKLLAQSSIDQSSYYIIGVYNYQLRQGEEQPPEFQETLVKRDNIGCLVVVSKEKMAAASLTQYIPKDLACKLRLQTFRQAIVESGGKDKFQKLLLEGDESEKPGDISYYFPEDICALQQLDIKLPDSVKVVEDIKQLGITE